MGLAAGTQWTAADARALQTYLLALPINGQLDYLNNIISYRQKFNATLVAYALQQAPILQQKIYDQQAAANVKKKTAVGAILHDVGATVLKAAVQPFASFTKYSQAGNDKLGIFNPKMDTKVGQSIDKVVSVANSIGHKIGQSFTSAYTKGAVNFNGGKANVNLQALAAKYGGLITKALPNINIGGVKIPTNLNSSLTPLINAGGAVMGTVGDGGGSGENTNLGASVVQSTAGIQGFINKFLQQNIAAGAAQ